MDVDTDIANTEAEIKAAKENIEAWKTQLKTYETELAALQQRKKDEEACPLFPSMGPWRTSDHEEERGTVQVCEYTDEDPAPAGYPEWAPDDYDEKSVKALWKGHYLPIDCTCTPTCGDCKHGAICMGGDKNEEKSGKCRRQVKADKSGYLKFIGEFCGHKKSRKVNGRYDITYWDVEPQTTCAPTLVCKGPDTGPVCELA